MPHSIESSLSLQNGSLLPKRNTSFPLQLPGFWLIDQTIHKPLKDYRETSRSSNTSKPPGAEGWASILLHECAKAIFDQKNPSKSHQLLWILNELASPYGDRDQRLAYYFLQALLAKFNSSGTLCYKTLELVAKKKYCFDTYMKLMLKFQEVSPWITFGHVVSNGAILEALEGESNLHIIDLSNTLCTQWPILLEALAMRDYGTPHLKLTLAVPTSLEKSIIKEIRQRMEKFARLMGVPFKLHVVSGLDYLGELKKEDLGVEDDEVVVVNCIQALQRVQVENRGSVIDMIRSIRPRVLTIVEEEVDLTTIRNDFVKCFEECLRFYRLYFDMLEESFGSISDERLKLERGCSRNIIRVLGCDHNGQFGEKSSEWTNRLKQAFCPFHFSKEVIGDVKALLRRYRGGWDIGFPQQDCNNEVGIHLKWREEPVVWASAWKPNLSLLAQDHS